MKIDTENKNHGTVVSVDGPAASGKSTVSRGIARELKFAYCDSGSLYRAVTWKALEEGINLKDEKAVVEMIEKTDWEFRFEENVMLFKMDGIDPGDKIRSVTVGDNVSTIAQLPLIRNFVVARLRGMREFGSLVMEGRDIGSIVFPDADYKYYLNATAEERARRRHAELKNAGDDNNINRVYESLKRRDTTDSTRKTAPLLIPKDAVVLDSTSMDIQEVVQFIVHDIRMKIESMNPHTPV